MLCKKIQRHLKLNLVLHVQCQRCIKTIKKKAQHSRMDYFLFNRQYCIEREKSVDVV